MARPEEAAAISVEGVPVDSTTLVVSERFENWVWPATKPIYLKVGEQVLVFGVDILAD